MQKQIDDAVAVAPQKIFITSAPYSGVIRLLEADIQLTNNAVKELQYFTGVLELYNADNELFYSGNFASSKDLAAKQAAVYKFNWELNPFLTDDAKVMQQRFQQSDLEGFSKQSVLCRRLYNRTFNAAAC